MNDLEREKREGLSWRYLADVPIMKALVGNRYRTPGFGLAAQLFACTARSAVARLGPEEGETVLKEAVQAFGKERGRRIAATVQGLGKPLTLKNWIIYSDIGMSNFSVVPRIRNGELVARVKRCSFHEAALRWGLETEVRYYCRYADYAILEGYNPDIRLTLETRFDTGQDYCLFRYSMGPG